MRWTRRKLLIYIAQVASSLMGAGVGALIGASVVYEASPVPGGTRSEFNLSYGLAGPGQLLGFILTPIVGALCILITNMLVAPFSSYLSEHRPPESYAAQSLIILVPTGVVGAWLAFHHLMIPRPDGGLPVFALLMTSAVVVPYAFAVWCGRRRVKGATKVSP